MLEVCDSCFVTPAGLCPAAELVAVLADAFHEILAACVPLSAQVSKQSRGNASRKPGRQHVEFVESVFPKSEKFL